MRFLFCLLMVILGAFNAKSQDPKVIEQELFWVRYYQQLSLNPKWILHFELDERRNINPDRQFQFFAHLHLHYKLSPSWEIAGGFASASTNSNKNVSLVVPEWRPYQEVNWTNRYNKSSFQLRFRLEQRYIHNNNKIYLLDGYSFSSRYRFRVQYTLQLKEYSNGKKLIGRLSNETFLQNGQVVHPFDQNRIYGAIEYVINKKISLEMGLLNVYQSRSDNGFYSRNVLRTTFYYKLGAKNDNEL